MTADTRLRVNIGGKPYELSSDDNYLKNMGPEFEPHMVKLFKSLISKTDHTLDIGANIGCTAILFGEISKSVHAFEPSPSTFNFLQENISASKLHDVKIHNYGLGRESGLSEITFAPSNRSGAFVSDQTKASLGHVTETIAIKTLDGAVRELGISKIDFIKIDVEGFEKSVLEGGHNTVESFQPIVVLELNHWCLNAFQRICVPDFLDYLRSVFPIVYAIEGNSYADLHDESDSYQVMYNHIIHFKYSNIVAAFRQEQLTKFYTNYQRI